MRGCAGAGSTLTCMSPPPLALHPCLDLYLLGFSQTLIAFQPSCLFFAPVYFEITPLPGHLSRPGGCTVWAGSGSRVLVLIESLPGGLRALNQVDLSRLDGCKVWVSVWLEASSFIQMEPWLDASNPEQMRQGAPSAEGWRPWQKA